MTQGLFINSRRPKSKKEVREFIDAAYDPNLSGDAGEALQGLHIEATSMFGNEYDGPLSDNLRSNRITFVGPDPYKTRNFYGTIEWNEKKGRWIAK